MPIEDRLTSDIGWPIYSHYTRPYTPHDDNGFEDTDAIGFNSKSGGNSSSSAKGGAMQAHGNMPLPQPIDPETPDAAKTKKSFRDGQEWELGMHGRLLKRDIGVD